MLSEEVLQKNLAGVQKQLEKFLDFDSGPNSAELVNNYDWFKDFTFLSFIREAGKHISINYMLAKDSVKSRLETGISFTEFTYQLVQGYDFFWLYKNKNCKVQLGGSDQWGNITTGTEFIRRKDGGTAFAVTTPLIKKSDGGKFGKTEQGNVWLDKKLTSPYKFYQFWLNSSDDDAKNYIRIFTLFDKQKIVALQKEHDEQPHLRLLQKELAKDITLRVHSEKDYEMVLLASNILFGKSTAQDLLSLDEDTFLSVFDGVPKFNVSFSDLDAPILDFLVEKTKVFASKGEARRMIKSNAVSINKEKINENYSISQNDLIAQKYLLIQKGKKNYYLIIVS
jgi:tyrosyl-tRNA synthetase